MKQYIWGSSIPRKFTDSAVSCSKHALRCQNVEPSFLRIKILPQAHTHYKILLDYIYFTKWKVVMTILFSLLLWLFVLLLPELWGFSNTFYLIMFFHKVKRHLYGKSWMILTFKIPLFFNFLTFKIPFFRLSVLLSLTPWEWLLLTV